MERGFQEYVHGENQRIYLENYYVDTRNITDFGRTDQELNHARERIEQLKTEVADKNLMIRKIQEIQRLTNNHVTNLEITIKNQSH